MYSESGMIQLQNSLQCYKIGEADNNTLCTLSIPVWRLTIFGNNCQRTGLCNISIEGHLLFRSSKLLYYTRGNHGIWLAGESHACNLAFLIAILRSLFVWCKFLLAFIKIGRWNWWPTVMSLVAMQKLVTCPECRKFNKWKILNIFSNNFAKTSQPTLT